MAAMLPIMSHARLSAEDRQRYARHLTLPEIGTAGQQRLADASVLIIGAGGLGAPAALYLAAAGVGTIGLVDHDRIELSNLQRQVLYATAEIGANKAETARQHLLALNPHLTVHAHTQRLSGQNAAALFERYDLIIDGTDRLAVRYLINDACVLLRKPLVSAAIHRFEGQAMTYVPGRGPCYRCLYPAADDSLVPNCAQAGVLGVLPGVMGSLQATEALKLLLGIGEPLLGRLLVYDSLSLQFQQFSFSRRENCAVCGDHPTITAIPQNTQDGEDMISDWTASELAQALRGPNAKELVLIDVREPQEWATGHLPDAQHIPLGALSARASEIPTDRLPVFICAAGGRSMAASRYFAAQGRKVVNLAGGMNAWNETFGPPPQD
jgi:adenylyltransferase/sulfurtransferase